MDPLGSFATPHEGNVSAVANCTQPAIDDFPRDLFTQQQREGGAVVIHALISLYLFVALAVVCDKFFVPAVDRICQALNMSNDVAGATFMAAATSAPELFVNVIGTFITEGDIGVGTIVGSAVFNILAVAACCGIGAGMVVPLDWWPLTRDCLAYGITVTILICIIHDERVEWYESLILVVLYGVYIFVMYYDKAIQRCARRILRKSSLRKASKSTTRSDSPDDAERIVTQLPLHVINNIQSVDHQQHNGTIKTNILEQKEPSVIVNTILPDRYPDTKEAAQEESNVRTELGDHGNKRTLEKKEITKNELEVVEGKKTIDVGVQADKIEDTSQDKTSNPGLPADDLSSKVVIPDEQCASKKPDDYKHSLWQWPVGQGCFRKTTWIVTWPIHLVFLFTIPDCEKQRFKNWFPITFLMCIVWIGSLSYIVAWMITIIGDTLKIPDSVMGITFLAAGTSVPEAVSSVIVAKQGHGSMGISNSIGSNTFDILLCLGLPWLIKAALTPTEPGHHWVAINSAGLEYSAISLLSTLLMLYVTFSWNKFKLDARVGRACLCMYAVFLVLATLIELNVFFRVNLPTCGR